MFSSPHRHSRLIKLAWTDVYRKEVTTVIPPPLTMSALHGLNLITSLLLPGNIPVTYYVYLHVITIHRHATSVYCGHNTQTECEISCAPQTAYQINQNACMIFKLLKLLFAGNKNNFSCGTLQTNRLSWIKITFHWKPNNYSILVFGMSQSLDSASCEKAD